MEQGTLSTYQSIVPENEAQWVKLPDHKALAQLHARFWGNSMQEEETRWRQTQPEDVSMDVDETAEEGEDDEIGPGCYILSLGIQKILPSEIWIRQEYIRTYNFCERYLQEYQISFLARQKPPSIVITGQPGIGKSYWVRYALRRRLAEKKPVMWYRAEQLYLFVEEGVYKAPPDFDPTSHETLVWTLIDTDENKTGIPPLLAVDETKHFIVFTTSPQPGRWSQLKKTTQCVTCIMNPWSRKEISKAAVIYHLASNDVRLQTICDEFGPIPRICFDDTNNRFLLGQHRTRRENAISNLSSADLRKMVENLKDYSVETGSHTLLLMKRMSKVMWIPNTRLDDSCNTFLLQARVELVSPTVKSELRAQLWKQSRAERLELYRKLANVEATRCIAGLVFESLAHSTLMKRTSFKLRQMVTELSGGSTDGTRMPQWHSQGDVPHQRIDFKPKKTTVYEGSLDQIEDRVYYVPEYKNQVGFDSFFMSNGYLYILQCTIASEHSIKKGLLDFFSKDPLSKSLPLKDHWRFVFVIPNEPGKVIKCPQLRDTGLRDLKLFSAALDLV